MKITVTARRASPEERHCPTDYYVWDAAVDGVTVVTGEAGAAIAYQKATLVRDGQGEPERHAQGQTGHGA